MTGPIGGAERAFRQAVEHWVAGDVDATVSCWTDDGIYSCFLETTGKPYAGTFQGHDAIKGALQAVLDEIEYVVFRTTTWRTDPIDHNKVEVSVDTIIRHRASGMELGMQYRFVAIMRDGKIAQLEKHLDEPRYKAWIELSDQAGGQQT
ncbi:MAG: nuclear transport factor 2 family protein [Pseudomonadota bacterium]